MGGPLPSPGEAGRRHAVLWLALAIGAVAAAGIFAILIALARVPALGALFPGPAFYQVALTLHVNLSQGVWFMAFAGVLWSLAADRDPGEIGRAAWLAALGGALGMVLSVVEARTGAIMSNYVPVLDNPLFLASLTLFGIGVLLKSLQGVAAGAPLRWRDVGDVQRFALRLAALESLAVIALIAAAGLRLEAETVGLAYFEMLFWGSGHVWQFALLSLLMVCWLELAPAANTLPAKGLALLVGLGALPVLAALAIPVFHPPQSAAYVYLYTWLMRWTSWEAPLLLALLLAWRARGTTGLAPGFGLSLLLYACGLLLGSQINGQTTLVTAHYHGTIGGVTLGFMAACFVLLPRLGIAVPSRRAIRLQIGFYGYGILLMMAGLAGAGLMGAPRKTPGELAVTWSVETLSRICLGVGGTLATIGIVMFAWLLIPRLSPKVAMAYSR